VAALRLDVSLCSANGAKLAEMRQAFPDWDIELLAATTYPEEDGATYIENARIKARYGRISGPRDRWMLADDSGIEVAALGEGPGVQTARWAEGRHVEKLLEALDGVDDRAARYVAELVLVSPNRAEIRGSGVLEGTIATKAAGKDGFGFDPIFVPRGETKTVAELGNGWKALHSHRALAARALLDALGRG
jgi:XTP/dITP diphosphohydrolase